MSAYGCDGMGPILADRKRRRLAAIDPLRALVSDRFGGTEWSSVVYVASSRPHLKSTIGDRRVEEKDQNCCGKAFLRATANSGKL